MKFIQSFKIFRYCIFQIGSFHVFLVWISLLSFSVFVHRAHILLYFIKVRQNSCCDNIISTSGSSQGQMCFSFFSFENVLHCLDSSHVLSICGIREILAFVTFLECVSFLLLQRAIFLARLELQSVFLWAAGLVLIQIICFSWAALFCPLCTGSRLAWDAQGRCRVRFSVSCLFPARIPPLTSQRFPALLSWFCWAETWWGFPPVPSPPGAKMPSEPHQCQTKNHRNGELSS